MKKTSKLKQTKLTVDTSDTSNKYETFEQIQGQRKLVTKANSQMDKKSALTPSGMLNEIKLPKQLEKLNQGILPAKNYVDSTKNA